MVDGYSFRMGAYFHPPKTTGKQREAITFVLKFLITPTLRPCAKMGHGCFKHLLRHPSQWNLWWAFSHHAVNTTPPRFQSRQWFSAEELKSFFVFPLFFSFDDDWSCLFSRPGTLFPFYCCTCLGKNKRLQIECVSDTPHYLLCGSDSSFVISPTTAALSVSSNSLKDPTWNPQAVGRGKYDRTRRKWPRAAPLFLWFFICFLKKVWSKFQMAQIQIHTFREFLIDLEHAGTVPP